MSLKKMLVLVGLVLVVAVVLAACGAAATPAPTEAPVVVVEPTATEAPTAVPTVDPAIEITAIFAESGHADAAAEAFIHWDAETEVPTSCAKCHSEAGFVDFIADGSVDAAAAVPNAPFTCTMCHNDAADALTSVTFPSGAVVENLGPEARCMTCHQGRQSKVSVDKKITDFAVTDMDVVVEPIPAVDASGAPVLDKDGKATTVKFSFPNVHYFAAGGTLYGSQVKMGYEYEGKSYDAKHAHVDGFNTCLGCHDQHSLEVKVEACAECHEGVASVDDLKNVREPSSSKDYDGDGDKEEGVAFEIEGLQETLYTSIKTYATEVVGTGIVYDAATNPYWFVDADGDGAIDQVDGKNVSYTFFTARLLKATYNYQVSVKDPGAFAHGGKYMIELLFDSIEDVNSSEKLTTIFDAATLTREDPGHFNGAAAAFRHWDLNDDGTPSYTVEAACAKCHSGSGLPTLLAGETIPEEGVPAGNGLMCVTCHDGANFPARYVVNEVTFPSGKVVTYGEGADSNLCLECHQGRASKKSVDDRIATFPGAAEAQDVVVEAIKDANGKDLKFGFINAHYLGIGAFWFGTDAQGFYEYEGKTYVGVNPHPEVNGQPGCVGCHSPHNGEWDVAGTCATCHAGITDVDEIRWVSDTTDWDGDGDAKEPIRMEVRPLRDAMYAADQSLCHKDRWYRHCIRLQYLSILVR
ncbi:hypothetical protein [Candidatus Villigracilis saccharophilus]|uniref:hypothetical protein n=1 Tax=Candidatus Villigracilis saccharophilus TaxID=3140684 RepID=UPI0031347A41|nr:hypothetical protein [Anaerolineales bacterium]